jgi:IPT/TIG domain-containing protein
MRKTLHFVLALGIGLAAGARSADAQLAQSASYRLDDIAIAGGGGGSCSVGFASASAIAPLSGGTMASANARASLGFLEGNDPQPTNAPVVFGVSPPFGLPEGGTAITITGLNFDKFGVGPSVGVAIRGMPATSVNVVSDTVTTALTPASTPGLKDVTVTSSFGSDTLANGFEYAAGLVPYGTGTPGCAGTMTVFGDSNPTVGNSGFHFLCSNAPPLSLGLLLIANARDLAGSDPFGIGILLHLDLFLSTELSAFDLVSDGSGLGSAPLPIPSDPGYVGLTYFAQGIWVWSSCSLPPFDLSSTRGVAITVQ